MCFWCETAHHRCRYRTDRGTSSRSLRQRVKRAMSSAGDAMKDRITRARCSAQIRSGSRAQEQATCVRLVYRHSRGWRTCVLEPVLERGLLTGVLKVSCLDLRPNVLVCANATNRLTGPAIVWLWVSGIVATGSAAHSSHQRGTCRARTSEGHCARGRLQRASRRSSAERDCVPGLKHLHTTNDVV